MTTRSYFKPDSDELNLARLRTFVEVAQQGGATRAAETLFRAQSAITRAVQELERDLGAPLFERRTSGMLLTPTGKCVLARAERVFDELHALARWCASRRDGVRPLQPGSLPSYLLGTRRLQILATLAQSRHMPSAARSAGVTQPAVSHAIKTLEAGAGLRLFQRGGKGLLLTPEGDMFVLHVRRALNELRQIRDDINELRGSIGGRVVVGALPLGRTTILPAAAARVVTAWPGIMVTTDESPYEMLVSALRAGDVDFILGALRPSDDRADIVTETLLAEGMVAVARAGHPLAGRWSLTLAQLGDARWILPRDHTPARLLLDALFRREGIDSPIAVIESADLAVIRGVLMSTDMIAVVSAHQLQHEIQSGVLTVLPVAMPSTERAIGLTLRRGAEPSPAARVMLDAVRAVVADISEPSQG
ncbi:LysR family transcriptional regulator [Caballeronia sp. dw_19]|uniref:LysR family transcriptional regulator n=1 Tax=Caballeronia sp. dw_19 TaxID=2719791 RepID=UPI001BD5F3F1